MLFGRKTPPVAASKPESAAAAGPASDTAVAAPPATAPHAVPTPSADHGFPHASAAHPAAGTALRPSLSDKGPEMTTIPPKPAAPAIPGAPFKADVPRRVVDIPGVAPRVATPAPTPTPVAAPAPLVTAPPASDARRLIVGRDISLSGEIGSCDILVVEGTVEAKLRDGRSIEITETGLFKGSVEIDEADIGGRFEGDLVVRGRLTVRANGKITGTIKYGELSVEAGGQLVGDVQVVGKNAPAKAAEPAVAG